MDTNQKTICVTVKAISTKEILLSRTFSSDGCFNAAKAIAESYCGNDGRIDLFDNTYGCTYTVEADDDLLIHAIVVDLVPHH